MEKEVFILTKEQIDAYKNWILDRNHAFSVYADFYEAIQEWELNHPVPLPSPVKVLKAIEISHDPSEQGMYESGYDACLSDLGLK